MKTTIAYRLFTVAVYTAAALFIALVANGLYHANISGTDLFTWGVYYSIYVYVLLVHVRKELPDLPTRVFLTLAGLAAAISAHMIVGPLAAVAAALIVPIAVVGLYELVVYVVAGRT